MRELDAILWDFEFFIEYSADETWKDLANSTHFHKSYEIYYLLENEILYHIDNEVFHIRPGTVVVVPPDTIHTTRCLNSKIRRRTIINLPESYVNIFLKEDPLLLKRLHKPPFQIEKSHKKEVEGLFNKILYEYRKENPNKIIIKSLLGLLLVMLGEISTEYFDATQYDLNNTTTEQMLKIVEYINKHFDEKIDLKTLSEIFYLNPSYISRSFKQKLNISFSNYLKNVRAKEVSNMLLDSNYTLGEIAEKTGFNSSSDLCRVFKSVMHISPTQYKIMQQNRNSLK